MNDIPIWTVAAYVSALVLVSYFVVYPRFAGADANKIAWLDLLAVSVAEGISAWLFFGSGRTFDFGLLECHWFWGTLLLHLVIELPFFVWYFRKHSVWAGIVEQHRALARPTDRR
jgi:hypothetical protein